MPPMKSLWPRSSNTASHSSAFLRSSKPYSLAVRAPRSRPSMTFSPPMRKHVAKPPRKYPASRPNPSPSSAGHAFRNGPLLSCHATVFLPDPDFCDRLPDRPHPASNPPERIAPNTGAFTAFLGNIGFCYNKSTELLALMNILIGLLVLGVIILVHEWGHFIVARLFGVRVDVFSIGFGPRLFGVKRGDTDWRVSALPLGGYVRMAG